jgi:hypothetical protein
MALKTVELALHRRGTINFINSDPTVIALTPSSVTWENGTKKYLEQTARDPQTFKVIWSGSQDGILVTAEGTTRRFDFVLVGRHDATVAIGDFWRVGDQYFQIEWVAPYNGYETKAGGVSHGSKPTG